MSTSAFDDTAARRVVADARAVCRELLPDACDEEFVAWTHEIEARTFATDPERAVALARAENARRGRLYDELAFLSLLARCSLEDRSSIGVATATKALTMFAEKEFRYRERGVQHER